MFLSKADLLTLNVLVPDKKKKFKFLFQYNFLKCTGQEGLKLTHTKFQVNRSTGCKGTTDYMNVVFGVCIPKKVKSLLSDTIKHSS